MVYAMKARSSSPRPRRGEEGQYRFLMAVSFAVFLIGALLARLVPARWRKSQGREQRSVIAEARAAAQTTIPFAFMN